MIIEDRYLNLLNTLIYDKRTKMSGILSGVDISLYVTGYVISFLAYMNPQNANNIIYVEDFEKGNVVFLLPFGVTYMVEEMEEAAEQHKEKIKSFFGDKFRDDMIMCISEDDRQEEIRKWENLTIGLENWDRFLQHKREESGVIEKTENG